MCAKVREFLADGRAQRWTCKGAHRDRYADTNAAAWGYRNANPAGTSDCTASQWLSNSLMSCYMRLMEPKAVQYH